MAFKTLLLAGRVALAIARRVRRAPFDALCANRFALAGALAGACLLAFGARAEPIFFDPGGEIDDYYLEATLAQDVEILGLCASACTMFLSAPRVCIDPDAELRFHSAYDDDGKLNAEGSRMMLSTYPRAIRAWVERHHALDSKKLTFMTGHDAIALGVPSCP